MPPILDNMRYYVMNKTIKEERDQLLIEIQKESGSSLHNSIYESRLEHLKAKEQRNSAHSIEQFHLAKYDVSLIIIISSHVFV